MPHDLVDDPELTPHDIALYTVLKRYADFGAGSEEEYTGGAFPGSHTLAETSGMNRSTVRACRDRLEAAGWLSYFEREGRSHVYFLHHSPLTEEQRDNWTREAHELRQAWTEGGARALFERLEELEG